MSSNETAPPARSLAVVLRDELTAGREVRLVVATGRPDGGPGFNPAVHINVDFDGQLVTIPKLNAAGLGGPQGGYPVYVLVGTDAMLAVGTVGGAAGGGGQLPIGGLVLWPAAAAPVGFLICDGSGFSTATYPQLFAVLGVALLPDLRRRVPVGAGSGMGVGSTDGLGEGSRHVLHYHTASGSTSAVGDHQHPAVGDHAHGPLHSTLAFPETNRAGAAAQGTYAFAGNNYGDTTGPAGGHQHGPAGGHSHTFSVSTSGGGPLNGPAYYVLNMIIRAL